MICHIFIQMQLLKNNTICSEASAETRPQNYTPYSHGKYSRTENPFQFLNCL
jgi:hypothetical protein